MCYAVGDHVDCQAFGVADCFLTRLAVAHDAGQLESLGDPAPIVLTIQLNCQIHALIITRLTRIPDNSP